MKFSILISSYNKGKYINKCISSCLAQNLKNYEVILFDNYSTDNTFKILKKFNNKIKIFKKKRKSNFSALNQINLINSAFKKSKGQIICLLDADDYFSNNKLIVLDKHFSKKKNIDAIFDLPIKINGKLKTKFKNKKKLQKNIWPTIIPTSSISCRRNFFNKFLKKSYLKNYRNLEIDFRFNIFARNIYKNYYISENNLTFYRQVDDGIMSNMKRFSKKWWIKRHEAHKYMKKIFSTHGIKYNNKFDYLLSKIISN